MKYSASMHLKMAALLEAKAATQRDRQKAAKQAAMARVFRMLAHKAEQKSKMPGGNRTGGAV